jgi:hypothetical protein
MSSDNENLSADICGWITKVISDDCMYAELDLSNQDTREAIAAGLKSAADYFDNFNRTLH